MPKKKRGSDADDDKTLGRPKVLPDDLDKRYQIRCNSAALEAWTKHAKTLGFRDVSTWIRKLADDEIRRASEQGKSRRRLKTQRDFHPNEHPARYGAS